MANATSTTARPVGRGFIPALKMSGTDVLVDAVIQLTHRIHAESDGQQRQTYLADMRTQRDLVRAEILRRTGEA